MKIALHLAIRNLIGAGLRTWLNAIVLSFSFLAIIATQGLLIGWDLDAKKEMTDYEIGSGQYHHQDYDPYDLFSLDQAHAPIPKAFEPLVQQGKISPVLMATGTIYPHGRMQSVLIKGISPSQQALKMPSSFLDTNVNGIPAMIGSNMASTNQLKIGDEVVLRFRDSRGTFDAILVVITHIFSTTLPTIDAGQLWIPLDKMQNIFNMENEATVLTFAKGEWFSSSVPHFMPKSFQSLVAEIDAMIEMKSSAQSIFYLILIILALLAVFDTQVLSIFRRQREIGTYVALGYTPKQVMMLFTLEGTLHSVLAALLAAVYGTPILYWFLKNGFTIGTSSSDFGLAIAETMYPVYTIPLVIKTVVIIISLTAIVSYLPARKIAKLNPTDALRGKIQ
jgi:putative ABC transport system permease protein